MIVKLRDTRGPDGITQQRGAECGIPGLAVADTLDGDWTLVHVRSGAGVAHFGSPEAALAGALAVAGLADWTAPASSLDADDDLYDAVHEALEPLGAWWARRARSHELADLTGGA